MIQARTLLRTVLAAALVLTACGGTDGSAAGTDRPTVVVTTSILGDVVGQLVADRAQLVTIMPPGASPHEFQASAKQAATMASADAVILNGGGLEAGLQTVIDNVVSDGVPVHTAIDDVETRTLPGGGVDPHFVTDPSRMADAAEAIADFLRTAVPALDDPGFVEHARRVVDDLRHLDDEVASVLDAVPAERRLLVTDHEVLGYFAEHYRFEVVGTIVPSGSTSEGVSGGDLAGLADTIRRLRVPAVFTSASHRSDLADTLVREAGGNVQVVPLFDESLGASGSGAETYAAMMRTDAERIAGALGT